jgi:hypothetical protein
MPVSQEMLRCLSRHVLHAHTHAVPDTQYQWVSGSPMEASEPYLAHLQVMNKTGIANRTFFYRCSDFSKSRIRRGIEK